MRLISLHQSFVLLLSVSTAAATAHKNDDYLRQNTRPTLIGQHFVDGNKINQVDNASSRFLKVIKYLRLPWLTNHDGATHDNDHLDHREEEQVIIDQYPSFTFLEDQGLLSTAEA